MHQYKKHKHQNNKIWGFLWVKESGSREKYYNHYSHNWILINHGTTAFKPKSSLFHEHCVLCGPFRHKPVTPVLRLFVTKFVGAENIWGEVFGPIAFLKGLVWFKLIFNVSLDVFTVTFFVFQIGIVVFVLYYRYMECIKVNISIIM